MGLLQQQAALAAAGVTDQQFAEAARKLGSGLEPNAIRRGSGRLADGGRDDGSSGSSSTTTTDDEAPYEDDTESSSSSSSSDETSTSTSDVEPEAGLMPHGQLRRLAKAVLSGDVSALVAAAPAPLTAADHDAYLEDYGAVRDVRPYAGENFTQISDEDFVVRSMGLDTTDELQRARDFARRKVQGSSGTQKRLATLASGSEAERIWETVCGDLRGGSK